jgi:hypothetical protein
LVEIDEDVEAFLWVNLNSRYEDVGVMWQFGGLFEVGVDWKLQVEEWILQLPLPLHFNITFLLTGCQRVLLPSHLVGDLMLARFVYSQYADDADIG